MKSISQRVLPVLWGMRQQSRDGQTPTLGDLFHGFGSEGPAMVIFILSLPFLSPISLGPLTSPASVVMFLLAIQIARGSMDVGIPRKYLAIPLPQLVLNSIHRLVLRIEVWSRRARASNGSRPAEATTATSRAERLGVAALICYAAFLLALPIPLLPFSNTLPALGIALAAYGFLLRRSRFYAAAIVFTVLATAYFALLAILGTSAVEALISSLMPGSAAG